MLRGGKMALREENVYVEDIKIINNSEDSYKLDLFENGVAVSSNSLSDWVNNEKSAGVMSGRNLEINLGRISGTSKGGSSVFELILTNRRTLYRESRLFDYRKLAEPTEIVKVCTIEGKDRIRWDGPSLPPGKDVRYIKLTNNYKMPFYHSVLCVRWTKPNNESKEDFMQPFVYGGQTQTYDLVDGMKLPDYTVANVGVNNIVGGKLFDYGHDYFVHSRSTRTACYSVCLDGSSLKLRFEGFR